VPTYGPVAVLPKNAFVDAYEQKNPYPYSPSKAKSYLTSHGWSVVANGTDTCTKPGTASSRVRPGIPKGAKLSFTFAYPTGTLWQQQLAEIEQSAWGSVGIHITLAPATFDTVIGDYVPPCTSASACSVEFGWWGGGWEYSRISIPLANCSSRPAPAATRTTTRARRPTPSSTDRPDDRQPRRLPELHRATASDDLAAQRGLRGARGDEEPAGFAPQASVSTLFPEYWYYVKS